MQFHAFRSLKSLPLRKVVSNLKTKYWRPKTRGLIYAIIHLIHQIITHSLPYKHIPLLKLLPVLLLALVECRAQDLDAAAFIPEGYVLFESYSGDLNKDALEDCVLILKKTDPKNIVTNRFDKKVDRNRRGILVLLQTEKGYQLAAKNYNCFSSENEDGGVYFAPELWIHLENQKLYIHYGHGRYGYWCYTFRFQDAAFKLIGFDSSSSRGPVVNSEWSINFLTQKKLIRTNTNADAESGEEVFTETWSTIEQDTLIKLSEIEDFDELNIYDF